MKEILQLIRYECGVCGKEVNKDDKFCNMCGRDLLMQTISAVVNDNQKFFAESKPTTVICSWCETLHDEKDLICPKCNQEATWVYRVYPD